jgi:chromosome segregation ATPase
VKQNDNNAGRGQTQIQVIEGLNDQIADFVKKHKLQYGAIQDVKEKINQIRDVINRREEEIDELKRVIQNKHEVGQAKIRDIEKLKNEQRNMLQDFENIKEILFGTREEKENYESLINEINDKIRVNKQ